MSFTSNAGYDDFIRVEVDGKTSDEGNYTVKSGSIIITLKEDYVAGLSIGEHTLGIVSESGTATAHFIVNKKEAEKVTEPSTTTSPQTGDNTELQWYVILMFASICLAVGVGVKRKNKIEQ